jgi:hydroxyethylthiazole kinase-like uncharacterized protein yjeF
MKVCTVNQMRSLDKAAIEDYHIPDDILMENAALTAIRVLLNELEHLDGKKIVFFCGSGNNGGDGMAIARLASSNGAKPTIILMSDPEKYQGAARRNYETIRNFPVTIYQFSDKEAVSSSINQCDLVVDAIFGTGLDREVGGDYRLAIQVMNDSQKPILSVDIPSGIHGDNGQVMGVAVKAAWTATFGLPKLGNLLYPGFSNAGKLFFSHISYPPSLYDADWINIQTNDYIPLPERLAHGYKGTFGQALFVAGAANYFGAPYFSALSFMKAGGGYSRLASPSSITPFIGNKGSDIVFIPMQETDSGSIAAKNKSQILELSEKMDIVIIGPGTSLNDETQGLLRELTAEIQKPVIIDGDGLTAISSNTNLLKNRQAPTVLTPHLGEFSRLTGKTVAEIIENPVELLQSRCEKWNAFVVMKGAHTLIGFPDSHVYINTSGNSGMATAGSGDVLTGTIAAMYGLGLPIDKAVRKGVFMHGFSGDLAASDLGEDGVTAQDILEYLPFATKLDREGIPEELQGKYRAAILI